MSLEMREKAFATRFNSNVEGFVYSRGYNYTDSSVWIRCMKCDSELKRSGGYLRKVIRKEKNLRCNVCTGISERRYKKTPRDCRYCGNSFEAEGTQHYCTDDCWRIKRNERLENKKGKLYKNLVASNCYDSTITLEKLYNSFEGKCYICQGDCSWDDKVVDEQGTVIVGDTYPSVDHAIPLSKGGTHTWGNVCLAHYRCNVNKSDNLGTDRQVALPL